MFDFMNQPGMVRKCTHIILPPPSPPHVHNCSIHYSITFLMTNKGSHIAVVVAMVTA